MFDFPDVQTLYRRWKASFRALADLDAAAPFNNVGPTAAAMAGGQSEDFGRLDYVGRQAFILTADRAFLLLHGETYGLPPRPAAPADGNIVVSATDALSVPAGARFTRTDGWAYAASGAYALTAAGVLTIPVIAVSNPPITASGAIDGSGLAGNTDPNAPLTLDQSVVTGPGAATATAAVDGNGIVGGLDVEGTETYRQRLLFRVRNPPHGGNAADYVLWASTVPGVSRVFVERLWRGAGTVRVFPLFDGVLPGGIPDDARVAAVAAALEPVQPSVAIVTVAAANPCPLDIVVGGLTPDTNVVRQAVLAELQDAILRRGRVAGSDTSIGNLPYLAGAFTFSASWLWQAIANASGEQAHRLVAPAGDVVVPAGSIPILSSLSFVA